MALPTLALEFKSNARKPGKVRCDRSYIAKA